ncbi:hypothetical protein [Alteraurantiacibacter palmitatis]|uniref:DUF3618 domain-containing protein n=1 Tax=Alteraurantiacibacter palmitatis TaxID=2054628 RepID=A0ABV7E4Q2_9SPHN
MSPLKLRLIEDRAMRDAARAVVEADIARLKDGVQVQGLASRTAEAGTDYLRIMGEGALDLVREDKARAGAYAALAAAALAAWLFRDTLAEAMRGLWDGLTEHAPDSTVSEHDTPPDNAGGHVEQQP